MYSETLAMYSETLAVYRKTSTYPVESYEVKTKKILPLPMLSTLQALALCVKNKMRLSRKYGFVIARA
jgi:hypothetical protein